MTESRALTIADRFFLGTTGRALWFAIGAGVAALLTQRIDAASLAVSAIILWASGALYLRARGFERVRFGYSEIRHPFDRETGVAR